MAAADGKAGGPVVGCSNNIKVAYLHKQLVRYMSMYVYIYMYYLYIYIYIYYIYIYIYIIFFNYLSIASESAPPDPLEVLGQLGTW